MTDGDRTSCTIVSTPPASCIGSRELVFLAEEQALGWAADLKELLLEMKQATLCGHPVLPSLERS